MAVLDHELYELILVKCVFIFDYFQKKNGFLVGIELGDKQDCSWLVHQPKLFVLILSFCNCCRLYVS